MVDMAIQSQMFSDNIGFPQDLSMGNNISGLNQLSFTIQQKPSQYQQSMQYHHDHPQLQTLQNHGGINMPEAHQNLPFSHTLASLVEKQRLEIDRFVIFQNERLKWALQEQTKQQLSLILKKYEAKVEHILRQKDEEIAKAVNKTIELEVFLKRVEVEKQTWQKIAKENEEMAFSLNNTIEQLRLRESGCLSANGVEDAESSCNVDFKNQGNRGNRGNRAGESNQSIQVTHKEGSLEQISKRGLLLCKACSSRNSCIVILPCSHLCLCQSCEPFLHSCPVCGTEKKAVIQALI